MSIHEPRGLRILLMVVLTIIVVGGTVDVWLDAPTHWLSLHVLYELLLIAAGLVGATALWLGWWRAERSADALRRAVRQGAEERDRWREAARTAVEGLGRAIEGQFRAWGLTPAEGEVALLLLKGHSHKAIAGLTGRSERTVRQHAVAVYQKAELAGRAELAAFFLGELRLPEGASSGCGASAPPAPARPPAAPASSGC